VPVGCLSLALGGLDVGDLLSVQALVQVHACGSLLDQGDHAVVAGAVGRVGEVDGVDGQDSVQELIHR